MSKQPIIAKAETREDFLALARPYRMVLFQVYRGRPEKQMTDAISELEPDEIYLAFDLNEHGRDAVKRMISVGEIEKKTLGWPVTTTERPTPYLGAFISGMGYYDKVYSALDVPQLVSRARKEKKMLKDFLQSH